MQPIVAGTCRSGKREAGWKCFIVFMSGGAAVGRVNDFFRGTAKHSSPNYESHIKIHKTLHFPQSFVELDMQPLRQLGETLRALANRERCVFTASDLAAAVPGCGQMAVLLSRAAKTGLLRRVCKGIYLYPVADYPAGNLLFHAAARLRADHFNYISLETVLSDAGAISQIPMNWISLMSSGRSHVVDCGEFGHIEFVHTAQQPDDVAGELAYDPDRRLWRASVKLALRDMKATRRSLELVDEEVLHELV